LPALQSHATYSGCLLQARGDKAGHLALALEPHALAGKETLCLGACRPASKAELLRGAGSAELDLRRADLFLGRLVDSGLEEGIAGRAGKSCTVQLGLDGLELALLGRADIGESS